jgi:hypothetical protein
MVTLNQARLNLASGLSGLTLLLGLFYMIGFYDSSLALNVKGLTILAIVLAAISFVSALKIRAPLIAALLTIAGIIIWIPPLNAIVTDRAILIPGPVLGVIFFSPIVILGLVKFATNYRSRKKSESQGTQLLNSSQKLQGSTS